MATRNHKKKSNKTLAWLGALVVVLLAGAGLWFAFGQNKNTSNQTATAASTAAKNAGSTTASSSSYAPSGEEKQYLKNKFDNLLNTNSDTIAYVYAPDTMLDEPVVQTTDNATYLDKTFDGGYEPYMGTVFMDMDNSKNFDDSLTWLFGHARGDNVPDHRMFNDVNYYDDQDFFNKHPYVVIETPERKYYYEAAFLIIVPETTAFYRTSFDSLDQFQQQLEEVREKAHTQNKDVKIDKNDKYLVLSTCRQDDETIRSNLYLRQIPDSEIPELLEKHGDELQYKPTR